MSKYFPFRIHKASWLVDRRALIIGAGLLFTMLLLAVISIGYGEMKIDPLSVIKALFGYGTEMNQLVIQSFRLPRLLMALLAGSALAISGAILQGIIRNPLASPELIGVTGGAAFLTVCFLTAFSDRSNSLAVSIHWLPLAALIGAMLTGLVVYLLAWKKGLAPIRLVLVGIGLAAVMQALTTTMIVFGPLYLAAQANIWLTGSVNGTNWKQVVTVAPWIASCMTFVWLYARKLNAQALGEELAIGIGSAVQRNRFVLLGLSTALAGLAVAFAGGIGFVGLMSPHIARRLVGSAFGALIPISALIGGLIVLIADFVARVSFSPLEVPTGVFTSAIGAPYFIYLLYRQRNQ